MANRRGFSFASAPTISVVQPPSPGADALDRRHADRKGVAEVRVVRADGDALVAGETVEELQPRADLHRRRRVLGGAVARVGKDALGVGRAVAHRAAETPAAKASPAAARESPPPPAPRGIAGFALRRRPRSASAASAWSCAFSVKTSISWRPSASMRPASRRRRAAAPVAAEPQEVAAHRDRLQPEADDDGECTVDAALKRHRHAVAEGKRGSGRRARSPADAGRAERYMSRSLAGRSCDCSRRRAYPRISPRSAGRAPPHKGARRSTRVDDVGPRRILGDGALGDDDIVRIRDGRAGSRRAPRARSGSG